MLCARCGKEKTFEESPLCLACSHQRSGRQLFQRVRLANVQKNARRAKANKTAMDGMTAMLDRFFSRRRKHAL